MNNNLTNLNFNSPVHTPPPSPPRPTRGKSNNTSSPVVKPALDSPSKGASFECEYPPTACASFVDFFTAFEDDESGDDVKPKTSTNYIETPLSVTPERTKNPSASSATPNRTILTPDGNGCGEELTRGGGGTIFLHNTDKNCVVKEVESGDTEGANLALLNTLDNNRCMTPISPVSTRKFLVYQRMWGSLEKFCLNKFLQTNANKKLGAAIVIHIYYELIQSLDHFHKTTKMAHNDIKPANILLPYSNVSRSGAVINDFGSMSHMKSPSTPLTPEYSAPEHTDNESDTELNYRVDYYSLSLTILEKIFGTHPFEIFKNESLPINNQGKTDFYEKWKLGQEEFSNSLQEQYKTIFDDYKNIISILFKSLQTNPLQRIRHTQLIEELSKMMQETNIKHDHIARTMVAIKNNSDNDHQSLSNTDEFNGLSLDDFQKPAAVLDFINSFGE